MSFRPRSGPCSDARPAPDPVTFAIDVRDVDPDAVTVDALARLQLAARRLSCRLLLRNASPELLELVAFMGLADVLRNRARSRAGRQPEEREQRVGVEEERELDDLAVLDLEHLERPRVEAAARLARLVLAEGRRAVRRARSG